MQRTVIAPTLSVGEAKDRRNRIELRNRKRMARVRSVLEFVQGCWILWANVSGVIVAMYAVAYIVRHH